VTSVFSAVLFLLVGVGLLGDESDLESACSGDSAEFGDCFISLKERACLPSPGDDRLLFIIKAFSVVLILLTVEETSGFTSGSSSGSPSKFFAGSGVAGLRL
jgi:hypothetical protein